MYNPPRLNAAHLPVATILRASIATEMLSKVSTRRKICLFKNHDLIIACINRYRPSGKERTHSG